MPKCVRKLHNPLEIGTYLLGDAGHVYGVYTLGKLGPSRIEPERALRRALRRAISFWTGYLKPVMEWDLWL